MLALVERFLIAIDTLTSVVTEAAKCFGNLRPIGCLLSIGTGIPPQQALGQVSATGFASFVKGIIASATECEATHKQVETLTRTYLPDPKDEAKYFRFNYGQMKKKGGTWDPATVKWAFIKVDAQYNHEDTYEELIDLAAHEKMKPLRGSLIFIHFPVVSRVALILMGPL